jgi:hypothetical protein
MRRLAALLAAALVVTAEPIAAQVVIPSGLVRVRTMPSTDAETASTSTLRRFDRPSESAGVAYEWLADTTRLIKASGFPPQVAYTADDGGIALWFPHSAELHRGRWWIEEQRWPLVSGDVTIRVLSNVAICFDYAGATADIRAPEWQRGGGCLPLWYLRRTAKDRRAGDVLGLAQGEPPAVTGRREIRGLADLLRRPGERGRDERKDR